MSRMTGCSCLLRLLVHVRDVSWSISLPPSLYIVSSVERISSWWGLVELSWYCTPSRFLTLHRGWIRAFLKRSVLFLLPANTGTGIWLGFELGTSLSCCVFSRALLVELIAVELRTERQDRRLS
jgi:hypothetical protein